jgi:hypothetical protein
MIKLHISKSCKALWCKLALNKAFMTYIEGIKYITFFRVLLDVLAKSMREECLIYFSFYREILELLSVIFADSSEK